MLEYFVTAFDQDTGMQIGYFTFAIVPIRGDFVQLEEDGEAFEVTRRQLKQPDENGMGAEIHLWLKDAAKVSKSIDGILNPLDSTIKDLLVATKDYNAGLVQLKLSARGKVRAAVIVVNGEVAVEDICTAVDQIEQRWNEGGDR